MILESLVLPTIIGIHLLSNHGAIPSLSDPYNNINPGIYASWNSGLIVGGYKNSLHRPSFYIAKELAIIQSSQSAQKSTLGVSLIVGAITGYSKPVIPMLAVSFTSPLNQGGGVYARITITPQTPQAKSAVHFSIEKRFP